MPEILQIAIVTFIRLCVAFALIYGLYRLIAFGISRIPDGIFGKPNERTWEGIQLLYTVPTGILAFLVIVFFTVLIVSQCAFMATSRWVNLSNDIGNILFLIACGGIFSSMVFGIYQDYPPTRLKILGILAVFSALAGISSA